MSFEKKTEKTSIEKINELIIPGQSGEKAVDLAIHMCEGIPGAITILAKVMNEYPDVAPAVYLKLYEKKILGSKIWVLYKDSNQEVNIFIKTVLEMD